MKLIVGLGNPGKKYENTRHNAGFLAIDFIIESLVTRDSLPVTHWKLNKKSQSLIASVIHQDEKLIFAKPQTFMNDSGRAIHSLVTGYSLLVTDVIVAHDDIDITLGNYKIQTNRGSAGHNGVKSIVEHLKTNDFTRVRIGIRPGIEQATLDTEKFVLKKFSKGELEILNGDVFPKIVEETLE